MCLLFLAVALVVAQQAATEAEAAAGLVVPVCLLTSLRPQVFP
jgi:hypothetical protein